MSTSTVAPTATTWKIDPAHSAAEFKVRHMMISNVKGQFSAVSGVVTLDQGDITNSRVQAAIEAASINTYEAQRDAHLKSADFLDVANFPVLTFESTQVTRTAGGELSVKGNLAIRGVTRPVVFTVDGPTAPAKDPWGNTRVGLAATTKINRRDFGLHWNTALETGGFLVGDEVTITLEVQLIKS
ncbi:MAG: YceI family protein [Bryobacteraceae bacterium]|jgi:polyisoprenoid-binding protein YceI